MLKKTFISILIIILILGGVVWVNRFDILLYVAGKRAQIPIAANKSVTWSSGPSKETEKPNVILIVMDDMGINDVSTFGAGMVATPNIDVLASKGALFTNGYSAHANCAPARGALMTGRTPARNGFEVTPMLDNMGRLLSIIANSTPQGRPEVIYKAEVDKSNPPFEERGLPGTEVTMAEVLQEQGYQTLHIGKWHMGRNDEMKPNAQGFNESLMMDSGLYLPIEHPNVVNGMVESSIVGKFIWATMQYSVRWNSGEAFEPRGYLTDYFTEEAERAIEANANRPFFLYLAHWGVHNPLQATKEDYEAVGEIVPHHKRVYAAMLRALDRSVERIMSKLEEQGIADNTIIVLTSDNGGADYVAIDDLNAPYRGWKNTFFEGGIKVPYSITWPKAINPGTIVDVPVNHYDLMPTIAKATGANLPTNRVIDGKDLSPLWSGELSLRRENEALFWSTGSYRTVQANGWKLQLNPDSNQEFLFNLNEDPTEQINLVDSHPVKLEELRKIISEYFSELDEPAARSVILAPIGIDINRSEVLSEDGTYIIWAN
ncbi:sulfatase-like hydrolase/transferase [Glaciecola petra]|uniref:Sulfatase-like hydrolase/transferase n=1 Tax=Glaciecola petra TaxID=3075602 RepID=A0ABU2ZV07_9ALTE|nr:sulfatase-like hydrolase/transferase [Aestuariibacter sp. P117]MDT0596475.1 sulfatase-like hydrolase/transferase [Aestuariibacter sp. P117]